MESQPNRYEVAILVSTCHFCVPYASDSERTDSWWSMCTSSETRSTSDSVEHLPQMSMRKTMKLMMSGCSYSKNRLLPCCFPGIVTSAEDSNKYQ